MIALPWNDEDANNPRQRGTTATATATMTTKRRVRRGVVLVEMHSRNCELGTRGTSVHTRSQQKSSCRWSFTVGRWERTERPAEAASWSRASPSGWASPPLHARTPLGGTPPPSFCLLYLARALTFIPPPLSQPAHSIYLTVWKIQRKRFRHGRRSAILSSSFGCCLDQ